MRGLSPLLDLSGFPYKVVEEFKGFRQLGLEELHIRLNKKGVKCSLKELKRIVSDLYNDGVLLQVDDEYTLDPQWPECVNSFANRAINNYLSEYGRYSKFVGKSKKKSSIR